MSDNTPMQLAIVTDVFADLPYTAMLDKVKSYGIDAVEMTAGGWGARTHCPTAELLADDAKLAAYQAELDKRGMRISALNTSCNPLWPSETGRAYRESMRDCARLAGKLGVKKLVCMSGLPPASPNDTTPNWIVSTVSWPDYMAPALEYQWKETIAFWKEFADFAASQGVEQLAFELFPCQMVYNVETIKRLREAVGPIIGVNLDPSHLIAMGGEPIAAARALKGMIFHLHGKDTRIERGVVELNTLFENKPVTDTEHRAWNYVAVGAGHDARYWKEFYSVLSMTGYHGDVSLEMEDLTMSVEAGVASSVQVLKEAISQ